MSKDIKELIEEKIGELAIITNKGFDSLGKEIKDLRFEMNSRFDEVDDRFVKIENDHTGRIENLEDGMRVVKTKLKID